MYCGGVIRPENNRNGACSWMCRNLKLRKHLMIGLDAALAHAKLKVMLGFAGR